MRIFGNSKQMSLVTLFPSLSWTLLSVVRQEWLNFCCVLCASWSGLITLFILHAGVLYLQYGDETKQLRMPNEITSADTIRALFVSAFPQQLTMKMLESPSVAIYIKDTVSKLADAACALLCGLPADTLYFTSGVSSWPKCILSMDFAFSSK